MPAELSAAAVGAGATETVYARRRPRLLAFCALIKLLIFAVAGRNYGYLSDELYFLDAAGHLAPGYVDFPPMIAWVLAGLTGLLGNDLLVLRGFACAVGILVTWVAVDSIRLLGGRSVAQWTSALVVLFAPAFLSVQSLLTMNVLDQLWWACGFWLLIRYLQDHNAMHMLWLGGIYGLALLTKLAIPVWFLSLGIAALLYARWMLARAEVWQAIALAALLTTPYLYWQLANDWPLLDFISAYNTEAAEAMVIDQPLFGLIATMNPPFLLVWLPGLIYGLIARDRIVRLLGTAAAICLGLFLFLGVKFYFATPLFILFAGFGGLLWERWLKQRRLARRGFLAAMAISGLLSIPIAAPVLPPAQLQQVADFMRDGEQGSPGTEPAPLGRYFPHFAEMHGWPQLTEAVREEYARLDNEAAGGVTLLAAFFGQAGALNQLDDDALPTAHSGHMNYHLWSAAAAFDDIIAVGFEKSELEALYGEVILLRRFYCDRCMARENGLTIYRARSPRRSSMEIRSRIKRFYFF